MSLVLTEEQELLKETARELVGERSPVARVRELRDSRDADGFSRALWKELAGLGWVGIPFPEEYGGGGLGYAELGVVLEECGRALAPEPFTSTVLLAGNAVLLGGSEPQRKELLPGVCRGEVLLALAHQEGARFAPYAVDTRAARAGSAFRLEGRKIFVHDGHVADPLLVTARTAGAPGERDGLTLFLVPASTPGLRVTRTFMVDSRNAATVELEGVDVEASAVVGEVDRASDVLDRVFDRAAIAISAEMLGSFAEAFDRTVAYLKTREQFGVPIGSFQALKHRAAAMFCEIELARSIVAHALRAIDDGRPDVPVLASAAKARCSDAFLEIAAEALQMHGGIGMTDEEDIGLFLKRARAAAATLGDAPYHRDRFATLSGF